MAVLAVAALPSASADQCKVTVTLLTGQSLTFEVNAPAGTPASSLVPPGTGPGQERPGILHADHDHDDEHDDDDNHEHFDHVDLDQHHLFAHEDGGRPGVLQAELRQ